MVVEHEILTFLEWLLPGAHGLGALLTFFIVVAILSVLLSIAAYIFSSVRHGPFEAFYVVAKGIAVGIDDLANTSPRRTLALARLAITEAFRRKVLIAFVVFLAMLLFAGWFLDVQSDHPARLYISFVLTATNYLILILALFLAAFSLPNDIKNRTIYTVVTKPVRSTEIIFGRVLGFGAVGTTLLAMMCLVSYVFVVRGLGHEHAMDLKSIEEKRGGAGALEGFTGETTYNSHHRHKVEVDAEGLGQTDIQMGHWHEVTATTDAQGQRHVEIGPPRGQLLARVPVYARGSQPLRFLDRSGQPGEGVNVGDEWSYRAYVEGASGARAIWTFQDIDENRFPNGLPLEMTLGIFRTHKGNIESVVRGELELINPETGFRSEPISFRPTEFEIYHLDVPTDVRVVDPATQLARDGNLFEDLVANGQVEISIRCADPGQYYGMSRPDMYLLAAERPFFVNFAKGYVSIWLQMLLVVCFGVTFSAFLTGPVAAMATLSTIILGNYKAFVIGVAQGTVMGGGPIESLYRLLTQKNVSIDLEAGAGDSVIRWTDTGLMYLMQASSAIVPDYDQLSTGNYVAYGFNIDPNLLGEHIITCLAYLAAVSIVGYFALKAREVAA